MPFDVSGNFSRLYDFEQDRNNGIKILASRVDGEFDNFAAGMNLVFFRSGIVAMTGDLNLGLNRIIGVADGAVSNPAFKFNSDPLSGLYMDGYGKPSIAATGQKAAEFNTNGMLIPGKRMEAASARFTGDYQVTGASGGAAELSYVAGVNTAYLTGYNRTSNVYTPLAVAGSYFSINTNGSERARFTDSQAQVLTAFNSVGALTQNGQQVWHAGNFNPASYQPSLGYTPVNRAGDTMTGFLAINGPDPYGLRVAQGGTGNGFIQFGQHPTQTNNYHVGTNGDGTLRFYQGNYGTGVEKLQLSDAALVYKGQAVYHTGNLPAALAPYAPLANPAFTGGFSIDGANKFFSAPYPTSYLQLNDGVQGVVLNTGGGIVFQGGVGTTVKMPLTVTGSGVFQNGVAVTGALSATGAITQNGQQVWHAGNFNPASYAPIANPVLQGKTVINSQADALGLVIGQGGTGGGAIQLGQFAGGSAPGNFHIVASGDGTLRFYSNSYGAGTERFRIQNDGATYAGTIYSSGNLVWHAGNFNPNNYLLTTGKAADTTLHNGLNTPYATGNNGAIGTAFIPVVKTDGVMEVGNILDFHVNGTLTDYDYRVAVSNSTLTTSGAMTVQGAFNATGAITQLGQQVYHTGNIGPALAPYAPLAGANFTGPVTGVRYANTSFQGAGQTNARNHFQQYNAGTASLAFGWIAAAFGDSSAPRTIIGQGDGVAILGAHNGDLSAWADLYIQKGGGSTYIGPAYRANNGVAAGMMAYQSTAGLSAAMSRGTGTPSGGSDGDLYFQYT